MSQKSPVSRTRRAAVVGLAAASALAVPAAATADPFAGGKKVPRSAVTGDRHAPRVAAATGSIALVDGTGMKWFANTNITFSTSSSASGAMSEASYTQSVAASTLNGGTTQSKLNDAFDGYNTLSTFVGAGAAPGPAETGNASYDIYNKLGATPTLACNDRELEYPTQHNGDVDVSRTVYVPDTPGVGFARWDNSVHNTGTSPETVTLYIDNNLGSDSNTVVFDTSDGGTTASTADTWIGSFQNWSGTTSSDPREGHVLQGAGAASGLSSLNFVNGDDNPFWTYQVTLQPGQTKSFLNYTVLRPTKALVESDAADLAAHPNTDCMTPAEQDDVVNFDLDKVAPVISVPSTVTKTATGASGATVAYTATATDAVDGSVPVTCNPPSGSVFPLGTTLVTCTATDGAGNTSTKTFHVKVAPPLTLKDVSIRSGLVHFTVSRPVDGRFRLVRTFVQGTCYGLSCRTAVNPKKIGRRIGDLHFKAGQGADKHRLTGKLSPKQLKAGRYRLVVTVTDTDGTKKHRDVLFVVPKK